LPAADSAAAPALSPVTEGAAGAAVAGADAPSPSPALEPPAEPNSATVGPDAGGLPSPASSFAPWGAPPAGPESLGRSPGRRTKLVVGVSVLGVLVLAIVVGVIGLGGGKKPSKAAAAAGVSAPASVAASPATPYDKVTAALNAQAAALVKGDEAGFLAVAGTALQARYRDMYQALHALGVTAFDYQLGLGQKVSGDPSAVKVRADINYCFSAAMCPAGASGWAVPPHIEQELTLKLVGGKYVISKVDKSPEPDFHQPLPWENGKLTAVQGKRVTMLASADEVKNLSRVLPVADQAAVIDDKFAALNGTPQDRYRIYLAGEKEWKAWYGGIGDRWAIGVSVPLNMYGPDVVLRMKDLTDPTTLRVTVQHELGHVVTLDGAFRFDAAEDTWLSEGIAEYIGWWPKPAKDSFRVGSVRWKLNSKHKPLSMVPAEPGENASLRDGDAFYGLSHFAVDCMAHKYGQPKLFKFVRLVLSEDNSYDQAAQDAYGKDFNSIDSSCMQWIRSQV
jgi:hypothetical protein